MSENDGQWRVRRYQPSQCFTRVLVCKFSLCASAPYVARYASSASLCRRNEDIGTGVPCHIPISDDFSNCSSACRLCRRPNNWNLPGWMNRNLDPCLGPHQTATWSMVRSIAAKPLPTWDRWCWGPRLEHKVPGFISMCPARICRLIMAVSFQARDKWETRSTVPSVVAHFLGLRIRDLVATAWGVDFKGGFV